jgi:hypothetical protein
MTSASVTLFSQAHALLIGVGTYKHHPTMNVPVTARDAQALAVVLRDPLYCGYPETQVSVLSDSAATREGILAALDGLAALPEDATVFLLYAGHGEYGADGNYTLTTHDTRMQGSKVVAGTGISEHELLERLRKLKAKRLLTIFNACHAGEVSPTLGAGEEPPTGAPLPEKTAAALLATGSGRVIVTACRENQVSYVGNGNLTLFGQALVDGLQGKGDYISNRGGFISAFDLYSHLYDTLQTWVPAKISASLRQKHGEQQEPELTVLKGVGPFAVSLYRGATALGSFSAPNRPEVDAGLREVDEARSQRLLGSILNIQVGGDVNTAGRDNLAGATVGDNYTGGDRTERRSVVDFGSGGQFGDLNFGDIAGRDIVKDNITVGDITSSSGIAIGHGARAHVTTGGAEQLAAAFAAVYQKLAASPESPAIKSVVEQQVKAVEAEAAKGEAADAGKIESWLTVIARMMPDILEVTANTLLSPVSGVATAVKKIAEKARPG